MKLEIASHQIVVAIASSELRKKQPQSHMTDFTNAGSYLSPQRMVPLTHAIAVIAVDNICTVKVYPRFPEISRAASLNPASSM